MIRSMTAFARQAEQHEWGSMVWEIRSVNHRYLEHTFKLHESMRQIENKLREKIKASLSRGKIECTLRIQTDAGRNNSLHINTELLSQLINAGESIQKQLHEPSALNPLQLLQWPGVMTEAAEDSDLINEQALALFQVTIDNQIESREREGHALKQFIEQRLNVVQ